MYGIADNQKIYEVDVTDRIVNAVHDARPDIPSGLANGFAYDTARDQFFFLSADKQLQFWVSSP
ncbi:hypothetical protein MNEG_6950 [Monoraphidium neglectum]|uniref:Uncharacterized protein n=1 Tax=Monoraphidium neglectum TaxID=145388 RepID=A0A0D2L0U3_9CHLO|nr:hypothetical protein MNEG_6950 [Monoraphidium neglectum]KIZ01009.1 hypothetical protein MNEG_6950 [Monoraphidium neglectum]|eukprot:XP_013900028.1 hypothetical protein MNEG_6950 [Monoraphidium neglectum]